MKKSEIEFHSDRGPAHPAINVKVQNFPRSGQIVERFQCSLEQAEKALRFAFESAQSLFWEQVQELATHHLGAGCKVYSEGRQGGWLVVHGLPEVEGWNGLAVSRWSNFARSVARDIAYRCKLETVCEDIEANQWTKEGAEAFNYIDTKAGETLCIADLKQKAIAAGFGPVVRKS